MASILRSSKFVRYIAGFARNVVVNTPREFDGNLVNTVSAQCLCGASPRHLATQTSAAQHDQNLERSLKRLDQDVRKSGRISRRDIEDVLEEIRIARSASSSQSLLVIRCCGNLVPEELPEVRTKLVEEIWSTLKKLNVPMDISHYNALLRVYLENEHPFSPTEFLADLESKGIEPNRVTYQRLIARYCLEGDIEGATKILEFMREKQLPVNENVFNALIVGHSQSGDMDSARGIISVMSQAGLEPSADTYTTLLCGYAKKGDIDTISKIIEECEMKEIYLLDKDYLDIIYALATNGHSQHIKFILSKCRKAIGYSQDAINLILRLINKGQEEAAFEILKTIPRTTRADGTTFPVGNFFIRQLVKSDKPADTIVDYCNKLEAENLYERGLPLAVETSLQLGNDTLAYALLEKLREKGLEIRQHFFWPLIIAKANADPSGQGVIKVIKKMADFGITPSNETIRDYVIPNLKGKSTEIISTLRDANVSVGSSACSLIVSLLQKGEIHEAAIIGGRVPAYYDPDLIRRPLTNAFYKTKDLESYITILRTIYDNLDRKGVARPNNEQKTVDKTEVVGSFLLDLAGNSRDLLQVVTPVLTELVNQGLSISTSCAEKIEAKLGEKMTEEISNLLGKLTSGELSPTPVEKKTPSYTPTNQMNIPQLERLIHNLEAKGQETHGLKRQLLTLYYRAKDLEKMETLLESLKSKNFSITPGLYAQLLDLYAYHEKLDKALENYELLKKSQGDQFTLDEAKIVRLAHLLTKTNFDAAIKLLEDTPRDRKQEERNFTYSALVWRFLNSLAEEGKVEEVNKVFDTLIKKGYIEVNNVFLGPLVKVHIVRKEFDIALQKFEWCVNQFKATPWKSELACQLIQAEDAEKLQKLTDLSTMVHGEINSLYDLVFAFVECGRVRQARKILETPGLQNRPQRINTACERYRQEGLIKPLEGLKDATKDLNHIDRTDIYHQLLLSYIKQDDPEKALGLWTQMQEEDLAANDQFLLKLGKYLLSRGLPVPFVMPFEPASVKKTPSADVPQPSVNISQPTVKQQQQAIQQQKAAQSVFKQSLLRGDVDKCIEIVNKKEENVSVGEISHLIEKLIQTSRINEATRLTLTLLDKGNLPINRVFRFLLNKLANNGDVEALKQIETKLNHEVKKIVSFDNRICHANLVAGKGEEYLKTLEQDIDSANDPESLTAVAERFPRGGAYGILERYPDLRDKFEEVAIKYAKKGIVGPLNVLWTHYFIEHEDQKADQIWKEYLKDSPRIMFQRIVQSARDKQDELLTKKLIEHLKISHVTEGAIGNAYSCLLDVLVAKDKCEEVVETFEKCVKEIPLENINRTAIARVSEVYSKLGKPFNYTIPPRVKSTNNTKNEEEV